MKRMITKAFSLLLTAAMILSLGVLPATAMGRTPREVDDTSTDEARIGPSESHVEAVAPPETNQDVLYHYLENTTT